MSAKSLVKVGVSSKDPGPQGRRIASGGKLRPFAILRAWARDAEGTWWEKEHLKAGGKDLQDEGGIDDGLLRQAVANQRITVAAEGHENVHACLAGPAARVGA